VRENVCLLEVNKRERKSKGQSRMENPDKLATFGAQNEDKQKQKKHNALCVRHHYT
jgi:hypothetical protein